MFSFWISLSQGKNSLLKRRKLLEKRKTLTLYKNPEYQHTIHKICFCGYVQVSSLQWKQNVYFVYILHIHLIEVIISSTLIADAEIKYSIKAFLHRVSNYPRVKANHSLLKARWVFHLMSSNQQSCTWRSVYLQQWTVEETSRIHASFEETKSP